MKEKINIAELLKDCPQGMELDCTNYSGVVTFEKITDNATYPIKIEVKYGDEYSTHTLTKYGQTCKTPYNKCIIFPKGKTTWEGFQRPFKDGDIIFTHANCLNVGLGNTWISIFKENRTGGVATYVDYCNESKNYYTYLEYKGLLCDIKDILLQRFATEKEKEKLFDTIKENGYKWNPETKTLEKLIEPKFKAGDKIEKCGYRFTIVEVKEDFYLTKCDNKIPIENQDDFNLISNKFDINTLKPFESRVLVRNIGAWEPAFWGYYSKEYAHPFVVTGGNTFAQCVPYEENQHLLGTNNDCDEYYKTWE